MTLRYKRRIRSFRRTLIVICTLTVFFLRTQIIFQLSNTLFVGQTSKYTGGVIDDVQFIKCYHWFRQCDSLIAYKNSEGGKPVVWNRVSKNLSIDTLYAFESGPFYESYLYVHNYHGDSGGIPISDLAISDDPLAAPLRVSTDVQKLIQSSDSSVFHKHVYQQKKSIWDRLSFGKYQKGDVHLLGEDWKYKGGGIWCKYQNRDEPLVDIEIYLGTGFLESRPHWREAIREYFRPKIREDEYIPISITRKTLGFSGQGLVEPFDSKLNLHLPIAHSNSLKILQLTDVHFRGSDDGSTLLNEFQTVNFISNILSKEKPDMVVITGDFLDGPNSFDYQTCIMKLVQPMIKSAVPYAFSFGYADYSPWATKTQLLDYVFSLPYCMNKWSSVDGHLAIDVKLKSGSDIIIYVLDSFKDVLPFFIERENLKLSKYSLAFSHLPIKEYRPEGVFPLIGQYNERSTIHSSFDLNQNMGEIMRKFGIMAMSCGYEHNNDCCLKSDGEIWLCYGGSTGLGLSRVPDLAPNVRIFKIDDDKGEITSWKRNFPNIDSVYDYQFIYQIKNTK